MKLQIGKRFKTRGGYPKGTNYPFEPRETYPLKRCDNPDYPFMVEIIGACDLVQLWRYDGTALEGRELDLVEQIDEPEFTDEILQVAWDRARRCLRREMARAVLDPDCWLDPGLYARHVEPHQGRMGHLR
jgi:hypothetical protein